MITNHISRKRTLATYVLVVAVAFLFLSTLLSRTILAAGSASLTLSPSSGSYNNGSTFTVTINENSGSEEVNAIQSNLTYDASKLQFLSIDASTSAFDLAGPSTGGSGSVQIARAKAGGSLTGSQVVAKVNFKTLTGSVSTTISFAGSSQIVKTSNTSNIWNGVTTGGTYTLTTPSTGGSTSTSTGGTTSSSTGSTQNTSNNTTSGSTNTSTNNNGTNTDPQPLVEETQEQAQTYFVAVKVVNDKNEPIKGAKVTIEGTSQLTDATGVASFTNLKVGNYEALVEYDGKKVTQPVGVVAGVAVQVQEFTAKLSGVASNASKKQDDNKIVPLIFIGVAALLFLVGASILVVKLIKRQKLNKYYKSHILNSPTQEPKAKISAVPPPSVPTQGTVVKPDAPAQTQNDSSNPDNQNKG